MCRRIECKTCGKPGYRGCGQHVEQVLSGVPRAQRCACPPASGSLGGMLRRLFRLG